MRYITTALTAFSFCLALAAVGPSMADDYPQWRGRNRDGVCNENNLLKEWPQNGPRLIWQVKDIGEGYGTPSVSGSRIFVVSNSGTDYEYVQALSVNTGKALWTTHLGKVGNPDMVPGFPGARSTPTVDGNTIYALGSDGDLVCMDVATGKERWRKSLRNDFDGQPDRWAYAESPLLDGDLLICTPGGPTATLVALNKKSGDTVWKCPVPDGDKAGYASAIAIRTDGVRQIVQLVQKKLVGVEEKTGRLLWHYDRLAAVSPANVPTPISDGETVFTCHGRTGALLKLTKTTDGVDVKEVYTSGKMPTAIGGAVKCGNYLYGGTMVNPLFLCSDYSLGTLKWEEKSFGSGSVCLADGMLYIHSEEGEVLLLEASPDACRIRGRFTPPETPKHKDAKAWPYPIAANGRLYIRDRNMLWCYDVRRAAGSK